MQTWKTKNGSRIFRVLSGKSNAYLIMDRNVIILVDTGKKEGFGRLRKNLESINVPVEKISTLVLTHTHYDHCQSTSEIKDKSNCKVIVSALAENSVKEGYKRIPEGTFHVAKMIAKLGQWIGKRKFGFEPFRPDILVDEEYDLNTGDCKIKVIATAWHSTDSLSIVVDDEIAIVGDAMLGVLKNSVFPPFADDIGKMIESWGKLLNTGCLLFLPGHGKEIKRDLLETEFEKYKRSQ